MKPSTQSTVDRIMLAFGALKGFESVEEGRRLYKDAEYDLNRKGYQLTAYLGDKLYLTWTVCCRTQAFKMLETTPAEVLGDPQGLLDRALMSETQAA